MGVTPLDLYQISNKIDADRAHLNKYTYLGYKFNFPHYRVLSLKDVMLNGLHTCLPKHLLNFISEQGEVLLIANIISGYIPLLQLRSLHGEKAFQAVGSQSKLFYGQGMLDKDFKYGDPLLIQEGVFDTDIMRGLYPNCLGTMTSKITHSQFEVLKLMTNRIILLGDDDKPGRIGTKNNRKKLLDAGFQVKLIFQYNGYKDTGEALGDTLLNNDGISFNNAVRYYKTKLNNILKEWDYDLR